MKFEEMPLGLHCVAYKFTGKRNVHKISYFFDKITRDQGVAKELWTYISSVISVGKKNNGNPKLRFFDDG